MKLPVIPLVVACALFMENMDSAVLSTALPAIAAGIGVDPLVLKLALTAYLMSLAIFVPASGWVADRFGARNVFRWAIAVYLAAAVGCAFSTSLTAFVVWRFIQGIGGAMMVPVGRAVIVRSSEKSDLVRALSWVALPALIGPMIGPPISGLIVTTLDWHWIFFLNLPIGIAGIVLATLLFPPDEPLDPEPFDTKGFLLAGLGLAGMMIAATTTGRRIVPLGITLGALAVGLTCLALYVRHARIVDRPILKLALLKTRTVGISVIGGSFFRLGSGANAFLLPLMLQLGFGYDALQSGLITFSGAIGALAMKFLAAPILNRFGFRNVLVWNALVCSASLAVIALFDATTPVLVMMAILLAAGFARSLQFTSLNAIAFSNLDRRDIAKATSLGSVAQQLSLAFGVAIGALAVDLAQSLHGHATPVATDFHAAFLAVAAISLVSFFAMFRLPRSAGTDLARR